MSVNHCSIKIRQLNPILPRLYCTLIGDENRHDLLNLGALEPLLRLIGSEDKVVKRNAMMCLGTMAQSGEYKVQKLPYCIIAFIS